jgi:hypothetical protein
VTTAAAATDMAVAKREGNLGAMLPATPPSTGPKTKPAPNAMPKRAMEEARRSGGERSATKACKAPMVPPPRPATALATAREKSELEK